MQSLLYISNSWYQLPHCGQDAFQREIYYRSPQGSNKVSSGNLGPVDFLAGQVTVTAHLPNGQGQHVIFKSNF